MARPGRVMSVAGVSAPAPLCDAAAAVLLTLVDHETPLWLDPDAAAARGWIAFHTGAPLSDWRAAFVLALALPDLATLPAGTDEMPETSATVILQVRALGSGRRLVLEGPGLRGADRRCAWTGCRRISSRSGSAIMRCFRAGWI